VNQDLKEETRIAWVAFKYLKKSLFPQIIQIYFQVIDFAEKRSQGHQSSSGRRKANRMGAKAHARSGEDQRGV
jgi:hypothetical protein